MVTTFNDINSMIDDLFMIGFNSFPTPKSTGFPFYNVLKLDEDTFGIELALAGYKEEDIEISEHKSTLIIKGKADEDPEREYSYKGISRKNFARTFALAEHVHVYTANLENGMLRVVLKRDVPEEAKPKRIAITS